MDEKFGDLIKELRIQNGYSIEEFSKVSGFTQMQIRNIENNKNKPRIYNLKKLADALNCSYDYLFSKLNY